MSVEIKISNGPLKPAKFHAGNGGGACVVFDGVVRGEEDGRKLRALDYAAYQPMAEKQLAALAKSVIREFGVLKVSVWHSKGFVEVGQVSFRLAIEGMHRQETLEAMGRFIERMKRDVPIWKRPVFAPVNRAEAAPQKGSRSGPPKQAARKTARKSNRKVIR